MIPSDSKTLTLTQQHFADTVVSPSEKYVQVAEVTEDELRGLFADWFKDLVRDRAKDADRAFARLVKLTATEVNDVMNDKRAPT